MPHAYYLILAMLSEAADRSMRMRQLAEHRPGVTVPAVPRGVAAGI